MKIQLMGNPNVGKSVIFSRLTGTHVVASNYSGTTVEFKKGSLRTGGEKAELVDVPGSYTLQPTNRAEEVAAKMVAEGDIIINVIDATNLERNLMLTLQLLETGKPMIAVLNMWDEVLEHGITIDTGKLEEELGIPVVTTCGISGEGVSSIKEALKNARPGKPIAKKGDEWSVIGDIVEKVQKIEHRHPTIRQKLAHASVHPFMGPAIAGIVLLFSFFFVVYVGDWLHEEVLDKIFDILWLPVVTMLSNVMGGEGLLHNMLIGQLIDGAIDFEESFGLLTTGLFIPLAVVMPFIFCFYFVLSLLEDIGYLPRLGTMVDNVMHKIGLHGFSIVPMLLGIGCNVPGAMAGRILETRKEKFIALTLLSICVPCMAQIAMVVALLAQAGVAGLAIVFSTLFLLSIILGIVMKAFIRGETPELLLDIPPYRVPYWKSMAKKIYMRMRGYIREAMPYVLLGILIINILYTIGVMDLLSRFFSPVITGLFGLPGEAGGALIAGFLRKDVAVGMLAPMGLGFRQLIVASVLLMIYFPCAATFVVLSKELGARDMLKSTAIMLIVTLVVGTLLNFILTAAGL